MRFILAFFLLSTYSYGANLSKQLKMTAIEELSFKLRDTYSFGSDHIFPYGGDDVGSGGDEHRRIIISSFQRIKRELLTKFKDEIFYESSKINISKTFLEFPLDQIFIVEKLRLNSNISNAVLPIALTKKRILINRLSWDIFHQDNIDTRLLLLEMILLNSKQPIKNSRSLALYLYSYLSPQISKAPFCDKNLSLVKKEKVIISEIIQGNESVSFYKEEALKICRNKSFLECRIKMIGKKGFGPWTVNYASYVGFVYIEKEKSKNEIKMDKCSLAKSCEKAYQAAPKNQLNFDDFIYAESMIHHLCIK